MINELVTTSLILVVGYAYPALQCFKYLESDRVDIHQLRFWCQYWITIAVLTILERAGETFVSWVPMYGEFKLALFIFLWYPNAQGTRFVYGTVLRPYVSKNETYIEKSLLEFRERAWSLAIYVYQNCTELSSTKILQFFQDMRESKTSKPSRIEAFEQQTTKAAVTGKQSKMLGRNNPERRPH